MRCITKDPPRHTVLATIFAEHVSRLLVAQNIPLLGATMLAASQARGALSNGAVHLVQAQLVLDFLDLAVMQLVAAWPPSHIP
jgi:hypothetical protein